MTAARAYGEPSMKKHLVYTAIALTTLVVGFMGCGKKEQDAEDKKDRDVYVAGSENEVVTLWKNGEARRLGNQSQRGRQRDKGRAYSVYVSGDDIYVAGCAYISGKSYVTLWKNGKPQLAEDQSYASQQRVGVATLWKNGVAQRLSNTSGTQANCVYVSGNDVYVAGYERSRQGANIAILWKNGMPQRLSNENSHAQANAVYVSGENVYVAGFERNLQGVNVATLWKNGDPQRLSGASDNAAPSNAKFADSLRRTVAAFLKKDAARLSDGSGNGSGNGQANCVYVSGDDIYVAGWEYISGQSYATLWKNGKAQRLSDGNNSTQADCVYVSGENVYVAGHGGDFAALLWKNGVVQRLSDGSNEARAYSVCVSGRDVYAAGIERSNSLNRNAAILWKNGVPQRLGSDVTDALRASVFVK